LAPFHAFQAALEKRVEEAGPGKLVVGLANIGYDWRNGYGVETHSFGEVMLRARQAEAVISTDPNSLNPTFKYRDIDEEPREVWYLDAVTAFNQLKRMDLAKLSGLALWQLGAEDSSIWHLFSHPERPAVAALNEIDAGQSIDYHGDGEVLRVVASGQTGSRDLTYDKLSGLITNQSISSYPIGPQIARWGGADHRKIVLTFDDGPDPAITPRILDILKEKKVPAVFFVLGVQALRHPGLLRRIVEEGHEIGNHTFSHADLSRVSDTQFRMELNSTQRIIESTTGHATLLFRPPYAVDVEPETADELRTIFVASQAGYFTMGNRIDGKDWWLAKPESIVDRVVNGANTAAGNVVLLHDSGGNRDATVAALPVIIDRLRSDGFGFISASALLGRNQNDLMPPVDTAINPYVAADAMGFAVARNLDTIFYFVFIVAVVLTLARALLIILWSLRKARGDLPRNDKLGVSVIVPAYNEMRVVCQTIHSLLASEHPDMEIIVVDDGSTDGTFDLVSGTFASARQVRVIRKENGGKSSALNLGITWATKDIVVVMDADTVFKPDTISKLISHFSDPKVGAVAGNAKVGNRINLVTRWQALEYIVAQNLDRRAFERLNCISVVPGAVGAWRRDLIDRLGGFHSDTLAEDADLTIRVIRAGYLVTYEDRAIALTEAPATVSEFVKQRFRWTYGMLQVALKHSDAFSGSQFNTIAWVAIPNILVFQLLLPCIAPIADLFLIFALVGKAFNLVVYPDLVSGHGLTQIFALYALFFAVDLLIACIAFLREPNEQWWLLALMIPQRFFHRQLLYYVVLRALLVAVRGRAVSWYKLQRTATVAFDRPVH
jgi:cellulose synthase/poly-beta-1,6-N-acetylglucosamine synthase-like glycosyltransferase/peptidoglycan/xylan/chitin deacetylase (PgdA/CDA1 family)